MALLITIALIFGGIAATFLVVYAPDRKKPTHTHDA